MSHAVPTWVVSFDEVGLRRHTQHKIPCIRSEQLSGDTGMAFVFFFFFGGVGGVHTKPLGSGAHLFDFLSSLHIHLIYGTALRRYDMER